jgi:glucose-6-phosphate isomerase
LGTRHALAEKNRESLTISINEVSAFHIGLLIALFERIVGFYAALVNVNAYHQPGVECGKKAAAVVIDLQRKVLTFLTGQRGGFFKVDEIADQIGAVEEIETIFKICVHLSANPSRKIVRKPADEALNCKFGLV